MDVQCPGCPRRFLYKWGKSYHSEACRRAHGHQIKSKQDHQLWSGTNELILSAELRALDSYASLHAVIEAHQAAGAAFYRLGCPRLEAATRGSAEIHWFPYPSQRASSLFTIAPYEEPAVPHAGLYLAAFFDASHQPIDVPSFKVQIATCSAIARWYMGTRKIGVRKK